MAERARFKAVAVDLDGTLLHSDSVMGEKTRIVLSRCLESGLAVLLCTGRSPVAAEKYRAAIGTEGPMVFYNGAAVIDQPAGRLLSSTLLNRANVIKALGIARRFDIHFHVFLQDNRLVYEKERPEAELYASRTGLRGEVYDIEDLLCQGGASYGLPNGSIDGVVKAMFIGEDAKLKAAEAAIDESLGGGVYRARSHKNYVELMASGVSKGAALRIALAARGINQSQVLAMGDGENDLPMLETVAFFAAPANAAAVVKARAAYITPPADEDGPAGFLEQYLLGVSKL